ncbi:MAG: TonB family protein [Acidobacteriia bacterium]|nr:TonB family protein [Terriglobia bacterium]
MFPQPMSRSEFPPDDSHPDLTRVLEQNLLAGFPPDLALDLVLNELVVRAAKATRAGSAALALARDDELVCRAATGPLAPDLGVPLSTRDGLSGACLQTHQPQLSVDTEFDPRVDPAVSRHLGIRSILIVPVLDRNDRDRNDKDRDDKGPSDQQAQVTGILEAFSTSPAAFSDSDQKLLEGFAEECARIRRAAIELSRRPPAAPVAPPEIAAPEFKTSALVPPTFSLPDGIGSSLPARRPASKPRTLEAWSLVLGTLAILAALGFSFLIGSRIGLLRTSASPAPPAPAPTISKPGELAKSAAVTKSARTRKTKTVAPATDELVVYEKGKVIFRLKPTPAKPDRTQRQPTNPIAAKRSSDAIVEASSTTKVAPSHTVWLAPAQAETRLLTRTEPQYPPEAIAAHRAGNVVLEVHVAEDGSVSSVRTLSGDPALAASATEAVRHWRYQPYRRHDHPAQFQTDVTLSFTLPN